MSTLNTASPGLNDEVHPDTININNHDNDDTATNNNSKMHQLQQQFDKLGISITSLPTTNDNDDDDDSDNGTPPATNGSTDSNNAKALNQQPVSIQPNSSVQFYSSGNTSYSGHPLTGSFPPSFTTSFNPHDDDAVTAHSDVDASITPTAISISPTPQNSNSNDTSGLQTYEYSASSATSSFVPPQLPPPPPPPPLYALPPPPPPIIPPPLLMNDNQTFVLTIHDFSDKWTWQDLKDYVLSLIPTAHVVHTKIIYPNLALLRIKSYTGAAIVLEKINSNHSSGVSPIWAILDPNQNQQYRYRHHNNNQSTSSGSSFSVSPVMTHKNLPASSPASTIYSPTLSQPSASFMAYQFSPNGNTAGNTSSSNSSTTGSSATSNTPAHSSYTMVPPPPLGAYSGMMAPMPYDYYMPYYMPYMENYDRRTPRYPDKYRLFIGNIPYSTQWQDLKDHLRTVSNIARVEIPLNELGQSKGYAIASYYNEKDAQDAINQFDGTMYNGRELSVRYDNPRPRYKSINTYDPTPLVQDST